MLLLGHVTIKSKVSGFIIERTLNNLLTCIVAVAESNAGLNMPIPRASEHINYLIPHAEILTYNCTSVRC